MKTIISVFLCLVIFLLGLVCGFFVSKNFNIDLQNGDVTSQNEIVEPQNDIVGTYRSNTWRKTGAVLILNEDGTCSYPTLIDQRNGNWSVEGKNIHIVVVHESGEVTEADATIVPNGILLDSYFFEKV